MEIQLALKGLEFSRKKKKWLVLLAAFGLTSYGFYRVYHLPAIAEKRKRVFKLLGALVSMAEAVSDCAQTIGVFSKDLKDFLQSESDQIPSSLKQVSKITRSDEFSQSITGVTQALTKGIIRGYNQLEERSGGNSLNASSGSMDQVMDKLFSEAGAGFADAIVGSFARNLVMACCSDGKSNGELKPNSISLEKDSVPTWLNVVCGDKCRDLIGDCIQVFVSAMVTVYLEKTKDVNTYDEFFAGLTNPKHETQVRNVLLNVSNAAIETLVKTSHQVLTSSTSPSVSPSLAIEHRQDGICDELYELKARNSVDRVKNDEWISKVSSTLAEPSNRKLVLDVTGRITFETVRSFLEILMETLCLGMKKGVKVAHEAAVEGGLENFQCLICSSCMVSFAYIELYCLYMVCLWCFEFAFATTTRRIFNACHISTVNLLDLSECSH
ncbi:hypothetical protein PTKIN_Ptkin08bG0126000 [Pterospermum kingtungense]